MNKHVLDTCKIGQGKLCCRYLVMGSKGFECAKSSSMKKVLDHRAENNISVAQGDNCGGFEIKESIKKLNEE